MSTSPKRNCIAKVHDEHWPAMATVFENAFRHLRQAYRELSVLQGLAKHFEFPPSPVVAEELVGLGRALRRSLASYRRELNGHPLLAHVLESRRRYRQTEKEDQSKSGKRTKRELEISLSTALGLGFLGTARDWEKLMQSSVGELS